MNTDPRTRKSVVGIAAGLAATWWSGLPALAQPAEELMAQIEGVAIHKTWVGGDTNVGDGRLYELLLRLRQTDPPAAQELVRRLDQLDGSVEKRCIVAAVLGGEAGAACLRRVWEARVTEPETVVRCLREAACQDALVLLRRQLVQAQGEEATRARHSIAVVSKACGVVHPYRGGVWCPYLEHGPPDPLKPWPPEYFRTPAVDALLSFAPTDLARGAISGWVLALFGCADPRYAALLEQVAVAWSGEGSAAHALWTVGAPAAVPSLCYLVVDGRSFGLKWAASLLGESKCPSAAHALIRLIGAPERWIRHDTELLPTVTACLRQVTGHDLTLPADARNETRARTIEQWVAYLQEKGIPEIAAEWPSESPVVRALRVHYRSNPISELVTKLREAEGD